MYTQKFKELSVATDLGGSRIVDLRSDTISTPTPEMRKAMAEAIVGDDVYGEDPTVIELEQVAAKLLEKEAALFVPSGTMGNLIAIMAHCNRRGSEAVVGSLSHTFLYEQGGAAQFGGVQLSTLKNNTDGTFSLDELKKSIRGFDQHEPITSLVVIENTHNMCGGKVISLDWLDALNVICKENSLKMHMDGARLFNAAEYLKVPVSRIVRDFDSICFCLSKGLTAPVGSLLCGSTEFIAQAKRMRKALGGGMRQVGIVAAAGLVSLKSIVPRLGEDHKHVRQIAYAIHEYNSPIFKVDIDNVHTNILMIQLVNTDIKADDLAQRLMLISKDEIENKITDSEGNGIIVKLSSRDWAFARLVTYTQITDELTDLAIRKILYVFQYFEKLNK